MTIKDKANGLVTRAHGLQVREIREANREADFVASTDAVDSYSEVIDQTSWRLDRFKTNPVILYGHQSYELPIGQATRCEVARGQLEVTIKFATAEANPRAEEVWKLVQERVLRAVSVGFMPNDGKYELRDGKDVFVLYGCDLREISVVAVPANHECLAKMKAASLHELGVVSAAQGFEADTVRGAETPEIRERIRSAIAKRDSRQTTPELTAPSLTTNASATNGATETIMTEAEIKALQEKSALAVATAQLAEKNASEARTKAENDVRSGEAKLKALETERDTLTVEKAALTKEHAKAAEDRDAAVARAEKAESDLIALEVDALIGKKISAAEKDDFIALRKSSPDLFTSMIAKRAPMDLEKEITKDGKKNGAAPAAGDASDLLAEFQKSAGL